MPDAQDQRLLDAMLNSDRNNTIVVNLLLAVSEGGMNGAGGHATRIPRERSRKSKTAGPVKKDAGRQCSYVILG